MEVKEFELTPEKKLEILKELEIQDFNKMNRKERRKYIKEHKKDKTKVF